MDGVLSQEEINALLGNTDTASDFSMSDDVNDSNLLTDVEKDAIGEISNISLGSAATALSTLVNQKVVITTPQVSLTTIEELTSQYDRPCVFINIFYKEGIDGNNTLILKELDAKIITDLMMGGDGTNTDGELTELHLSAICEAMNQMMGSSATSISSMLQRKVDISPPSAELIDLNDEISEDSISSFLNGTFVKVQFRMEIGTLVDSELMQLYPIEFAKELYEKFVGGSSSSDVKEEKQEKEQPKPEVTPSQVSSTEQIQSQPEVVQNIQPQMGVPMGMPVNMGMQPQMPQNMNVSTAQFQPFIPIAAPLNRENIDLIMDVPLEVTVELGRTNKSIQEILEFSPGTIIELNKIAGEPVDVLVNGKAVARGEVVVIEENFGVRITDIVR